MARRKEDVQVVNEATQEVLDRLVELGFTVKHQGESWYTRCPAHPDNNPSLSISQGANGKVLLFCHAGCSFRKIIRALGIKRKVPDTPFRIENLAEQKLLPVSYLEKLGIRSYRDYVEIPYFTEKRGKGCRIRYRDWKNCWWKKNDDPIVAYGLWMLKRARKLGYLIIVEGESDCWTLWYHGYPALGLPGSQMQKTLETSYLTGIEKIYVVQETDEAGEKFVTGLDRHLRIQQWKGEFLVMKMPYGEKDPNDFWARCNENPNKFKWEIDEALKSATPPPKPAFDPRIEASYHSSWFQELIPRNYKLLHGLIKLEWDLTGKRGKMFNASYSLISQVTGIASDSTISTGLSELEAYGLITIERGKKKKESCFNETNRIRINFPFPKKE